MKPIREKKHRLPEDAYWGAKSVSFTACIMDRRRPFANASITHHFTGILRDWVIAKNCHASIYCFMPDHLHVIIGGNDEAGRPKEAMDEFKQTTSQWFVDNRPEFHWQKDYHDHIIRISDDWRNHVNYILRNPVRAGFAEYPLQYPYLGTIGVDITDVIHDL